MPGLIGIRPVPFPRVKEVIDGVLADIMISRHEAFVRKAAALEKPRATRDRAKARK